WAVNVTYFCCGSHGVVERICIGQRTAFTPYNLNKIKTCRRELPAHETVARRHGSLATDPFHEKYESNTRALYRAQHTWLGPKAHHCDCGVGWLEAGAYNPQYNNVMAAALTTPAFLAPNPPYPLN